MVRAFLCIEQTDFFRMNPLLLFCLALNFTRTVISAFIIPKKNCSSKCAGDAGSRYQLTLTLLTVYLPLSVPFPYQPLLSRSSFSVNA